MTLLCLKGGRIVDPAWDRDEIGDVWVRDGVICARPTADESPDEVIDCAGLVVMAGAIDVHSHIAGGNVNTARMLLPEAHRATMAARLDQPFATAKWSTWETGRRYAEMGFTTVVEPAVAPVGAVHAHLEMADIPNIDRAGLAVLGNDDFLLSMMRDRESADCVCDYVAWTLEATRCLGIKVINAGGAEAFKANARSFDLDDRVPAYGVTSRAILETLLDAVWRLNLRHPLHVHCNNLGQPGNVETAIRTIEAAGDFPIHLAHIQFYGYGAEGKRGFSSGAQRLIEAVAAAPNVTIDVGQVLFGPTVTISSDTLRQYSARGIANPKKWALIDGDANGGGIVPYKYRARDFVNAMQWAIGLEIFLLMEDPWRVFFTTDHPNGAPFTRYPELFHLLMSRDARAEALAQLPESVRALTLLKDIDREYSLTEIAIMTRAAPARLLGLHDRGALAPGCVADVAAYPDRADGRIDLSRASLVLKNGRLVVRDGAVVAPVDGATIAVRRDYDPAIAQRLQAYYDRWYALPLEAFKVPDGVAPIEVRTT